MIIGKVVPATIENLMKSEFTFYLTGSRFFGNVTEKSDWDFFVKDSPEVREFLESICFSYEYQGNSGYKDAFLTTVMYSRIPRGIHVQLINEVELKVKVQNYLKDFPWDSIPKENRDAIWDWARVNVVRG